MAAQVVDRQASGMQQPAHGSGNASVVSGQLLPRVAGQFLDGGIGRHRALAARGAKRAVQIGTAIETGLGGHDANYDYFTMLGNEP